MTKPPGDDPLWPEFKSLWPELQKAGKELLVAGGYGLFLKQHWLIEQQTIPTIVPLSQWVDAVPRVTKDVDIVVSLDLIASKEAQAVMAQALKSRGFKADDPLWQFSKDLGEDRHIKVEFHTWLPSPNDKHFSMDAYRVKHKPSLGESGIHGRQNPEAIGADHHPFDFEIDGVSISVPNPLSWCVMKLTAMQDRWMKADEVTREEEHRTFHRAQAIKHARDACRAVALSSEVERNNAESVIAVVQKTPEYQNAIQICAEYFAEAGRGSQAARAMWAPDDLTLLRNILAGWFPPPNAA